MDKAEREALRRKAVAMFKQELGEESEPVPESPDPGRAAAAAELLRLLWLAEDDTSEHQDRAVHAVRWLGETGNSAVARVLAELTGKGPTKRLEAAREAIRRIRQRAERHDRPSPLFPPPLELRPSSPGDVEAHRAEQDELLRVATGASPEDLLGIVERFGEIGDCEVAQWLYAQSHDGPENVREVAEQALVRLKWRMVHGDWEDSEQDLLIAECHDPSTVDPRAAVQRLGEIGDRRAAVALQSMALKADPAVREVAQAALDRLRVRLGVAAPSEPRRRRIAPAPPEPPAAPRFQAPPLPPPAPPPMQASPPRAVQPPPAPKPEPEPDPKPKPPVAAPAVAPPEPLEPPITVEAQAEPDPEYAMPPLAGRPPKAAPVVPGPIPSVTPPGADKVAVEDPYAFAPIAETITVADALKPLPDTETAPIAESLRVMLDDDDKPSVKPKRHSPK